MPSFELKPTSIALFPTAADPPNSHQQHYLSPPLTPFLFPAYSDQHEPKAPTSETLFQRSLPALRDMLPSHEELRQASPLDPERHVFPLPESQQHLELDPTGLVDSNSTSTPRGAHHISDPARLLPLYTLQPHTTGLPPSIVSPLLRRNKAHVASACVNCKKAHLACDANRPCRRCVSLDKQDSCIDVQHKRRGRPRLKDAAPSANSLQSERRPSFHRHASDDEWKLQSSPSLRREYHHNRSYSHGSAARHPYPNPTPPTSGYPTHGPSRKTPSYFDIPSPSATTSHYPVPTSPNYYPYTNSPQLGGRQSSQTFSSPSSPYQLSHTSRTEFRFSQPTHSLLPLPDPHPNMTRRGSFPSNSHQSETELFPRRPMINRSETTPAIHTTERQWGTDSDADAVTLPSLKDLGVPLR